MFCRVLQGKYALIALSHGFSNMTYSRDNAQLSSKTINSPSSPQMEIGTSNVNPNATLGRFKPIHGSKVFETRLTHVEPRHHSGFTVVINIVQNMFNAVIRCTKPFSVLPSRQQLLPPWNNIHGHDTLSTFVFQNAR